MGICTACVCCGIYPELTNTSQGRTYQRTRNHFASLRFFTKFIGRHATADPNSKLGDETTQHQAHNDMERRPGVLRNKPWFWTHKTISARCRHLQLAARSQHKHTEHDKTKVYQIRLVIFVYIPPVLLTDVTTS